MTTLKKNVNVSADMKKVKRLLKEIPKDRQPIAQGLYNELVFMQNTLERLKKQVEEEGPVSMFKQGRQEFLREHPALKAYNTTITRFGGIYKQLLDLLPPAGIEQTKDPLIEFMSADEIMGK